MLREAWLDPPTIKYYNYRTLKTDFNSKTQEGRGTNNLICPTTITGAQK